MLGTTIQIKMNQISQTVIQSFLKYRMSLHLMMKIIISMKLRILPVHARDDQVTVEFELPLNWFAIVEDTLNPIFLSIDRLRIKTNRCNFFVDHGY